MRNISEKQKKHPKRNGRLTIANTPENINIINILNSANTILMSYLLKYSRYSKNEDFLKNTIYIIPPLPKPMRTYFSFLRFV